MSMVPMGHYKNPFYNSGLDLQACMLQVPLTRTCMCLTGMTDIMYIEVGLQKY